MTVVDLMAGPQRAHAASQSMPATYVLNDALTQATLMAFVRGLKAEDLFAGAQQLDELGIIDAVAFKAAFPSRTEPARFDRLRVRGHSYAVEAWRAAPEGNPVFFKLLLRGGQQ